MGKLTICVVVLAFFFIPLTFSSPPTTCPPLSSDSLVYSPNTRTINFRRTTDWGAFRACGTYSNPTEILVYLEGSNDFITFEWSRDAEDFFTINFSNFGGIAYKYHPDTDSFVPILATIPDCFALIQNPILNSLDEMVSYLRAMIDNQVGTIDARAKLAILLFSLEPIVFAPKMVQDCEDHSLFPLGGSFHDCNEAHFCETVACKACCRLNVPNEEDKCDREAEKLRKISDLKLSILERVLSHIPGTEEQQAVDDVERTILVSIQICKGGIKAREKACEQTCDSQAGGC